MEPNAPMQTQPGMNQSAPSLDKARTTPKDFFLHLGLIVTLYAGIIGLLNLLFRVIDVAFPQVDRNYYYGYYGSTISWPVAMLIILFPLFVLFSWLIEKEHRANPAKRNLGFRKWLLYITLFIAGGVIVGDLITVLYYFLDGQNITTGFISKVVSVLVVSALVFGYYWNSLRKPEAMAARNKLYAGIAALIVIASIAWGFSVIGSPRTQRMMRYDSQKVSDLQNIQSQIIYFWQQKAALPNNIDELANPLSGFLVPKDPQTGKAYEYRKTASTTFELCADFSAKSSSSMMPSKPYLDSAASDQNWNHDKGRTCFSRTIDPKLYPPRVQGDTFEQRGS